MHPRPQHRYLIDYIIPRHQDLGEILDTRALRGAHCWTNHPLLRCKVRFAVHEPVQKKPSCITRKLDVSRVDNELVEKLQEHLSALPEDADTTEYSWSLFKDSNPYLVLFSAQQPRFETGNARSSLTKRTFLNNGSYTSVPCSP